MTFVNVSLLAGTALVALPIVLHLIMRQRPKRFEFPALRFVQKRHDSNRRRLRLRHLLLLLLRAAAILLLALALARPSIHFGGMLGSQEQPVAAALVFDTAPRMEYRHGNESRLEVARDLGKWLLSRLPEQSEIAVLDTRLGRATFPIDHGLARQRIDRLASVANSQPLPGVIAEALSAIEKSKLPNKELYIFTDLSRGGWPAGTTARLQSQLAKVGDVGIYIVDVGTEKPSNFALGDVRLSGQILSARSPLVIDAELSCLGAGGRRSVELQLLDRDSQPQTADSQTVAVEPGRPQTVRLVKGGLGPGTHQGLLRIMGRDGLEADDTRYFTVEMTPAWRILLVAPKPAERYALFLRESLAPSEYRKRGEAWFDCDIVDIDRLADRDLDDYAAVCLLDPTPIPEGMWKALGDYVAGGGGLAVFLGRNANRSVESFNGPTAQELLPGKLLRQARTPDGDVYLAPQNFDHPILSEFREGVGVTPWEACPVFRYWELDDPVGTILSYRDRRPAVLQRTLGGGHVLTMTTPISDDPNRDPWNLLTSGQSWPTMILSVQMVSYLVGSSQQQLNYFAGQEAVLQIAPESPYRSYLLTAPDNLRIKVSPDLKQHILRIGSTDWPGNYRIRAGGDGGVSRGFSVNLSPRQTQLERIDPQQLTDTFGETPFRMARSRDEIEIGVRRGRVGRELFPMLILAVAIVLGLESLVANRFYRG